ncbi:Uncharacterized protein PHSC3_001047 [Chlamydiales bacterium STE3]|nr:Uncharacterized protein PHSC3_001047 [Chlamydiales bacterium STE3]
MISNELVNLAAEALYDARQSSRSEVVGLPVNSFAIKKFREMKHLPTEQRINSLMTQMQDSSRLYLIFDEIFNKKRDSIESLKQYLEDYRDQLPLIPHYAITSSQATDYAQIIGWVEQETTQMSKYKTEVEERIFLENFLNNFIHQIEQLKEILPTPQDEKFIKKLHLEEIIQSKDLTELENAALANPIRAEQFINDYKEYLDQKMSNNFLKKIIDFLWLPWLPQSPPKKRILALEKTLNDLEKSPFLKSPTHEIVISNFELMYAIALLSKQPDQEFYNATIVPLLEKAKKNSPTAEEILKMGYEGAGKFSKNFTKEELKEMKRNVLQSLNESGLDKVISKEDVRNLFSCITGEAKSKTFALKALRTLTTFTIATIVGVIVVPPAIISVFIVGLFVALGQGGL